MTKFPDSRRLKVIPPSQQNEDGNSFYSFDGKAFIGEEELQAGDWISV